MEMAASVFCQFSCHSTTMPIAQVTVRNNEGIFRWIRHRRFSPRFGVKNLQHLACLSKNLETSSRETEGVRDGVGLTLRELCAGMVPAHFLDRAEELGFQQPTSVQLEALPLLLSGKDCILHSQTGSGKTLAYLLPALAKISPSRAAVQVIVVVPTRELGIQVARVTRKLAVRAIHSDLQKPKSSVSVMTLLDGGSCARQKKWLKVEPPQLIVGTLECICRMIETSNLKMNAVGTIIVDEVDTSLHAAMRAPLQKLLTMHTLPDQRQTIFASATIAQHHRFLKDCVQHKWTKSNLVHVHIQPAAKMPANLLHRYVLCSSEQKLEALYAVLCGDAPQAAFIFVNDLSEKAKRAGYEPSTTIVHKYISSMVKKPEHSADQEWNVLILEEDNSIVERFSTFTNLGGERCLLVATDLAARGLDYPEVTHIYNFDLPMATSYIHRAGRTARKPLESEMCTVTSFVTSKELFLIERLENELSCSFLELKLSLNPHEHLHPGVTSVL